MNKLIFLVAFIFSSHQFFADITHHPHELRNLFFDFPELFNKI